MPFDPWSRPTLAELQCLSAGERETTDARFVPQARFPCRIPAELITARGNSVSAMTQSIGPESILLIHKGIIPLGDAELRLAHDRESTDRHAHVVHTTPCEARLYLTEVVVHSQHPPPTFTF